MVRLGSGLFVGRSSALARVSLGEGLGLVVEGVGLSVGSYGTYMPGPAAPVGDAIFRCVGIADTSLSLSLSLSYVG
jgi:hypothetical protein